MKNKLILITLIIVYSSISTPLIKKFISNSTIYSTNIEEIAIANDLWDYISRFSLNN